MEQAHGAMAPADVALGAAQHVPDSDLPLLAARWLSEGWQSEPLIELAGMSRAEAHVGGRRQLPLVLNSLGFDFLAEPQVSGLARYAAVVGWAVRAMEGPFIPYSATQKVLEAVEDNPQAFKEMPGVDALHAAGRAYEAASGAARTEADTRLRELLLALAAQLGVDK